MKREKVLPVDPGPISLAGWVGLTFLLILLAGMVYLFYNMRCIDGCGPYHNSTGVADLDGDGDPDVVLNNLRHESETVVWAGPTLWINQGGGKFAPRGVEAGGPSAVAGDVDGDGDADLVQLGYSGLQIHLNYGEQDPVRGNFRVWYGVSPQEELGYPGMHGSVLLGDLDNDSRLDAFVGGCCSVLLEENGKQSYYASISWVWINTLEENDRLARQGRDLSWLGDLPMRPALGDLDGDGDLDVFAAIQPPKKGGSYVSADRVLLNEGNGNFHDSGQLLAEAGGLFASIQQSLDLPAAGSGAVALGDLDGDGDLDALVGKARGAVIWTNQGGAQGGQAGVFADSGQRLGRVPIEAAFLADLDADGDLDAVLGGKAQASIWWNDGQAGFQDSGQRLRYDQRHGLAVGDFDGDGFVDLFSAAYDSDYHLWLNQGDGRLQEGS